MIELRYQIRRKEHACAAALPKQEEERILQYRDVVADYPCEKWKDVSSVRSDK